jgi:hypothetical protein
MNKIPYLLVMSGNRLHLVVIAEILFGCIYYVLFFALKVVLISTYLDFLYLL